jgi:D-alanyl-lipoteichoic acid acyltransferase DltB (MBOAT superfamily)
MLRKHYRHQNLLLLAASYLFYGWWDVRFLFLIILSTVVDFVSTVTIDRGWMAIRQRIKASVFLLGSLFAFVVAKWDAVTVSLKGPSVSIDWDAFLRFGRWDGWIVGVCLSAVIVLNLLYPFLCSIKAEHRKRLFLVFSVVVNLTVLGFFKYFNFFADNLIAFSESAFGYTPDFLTIKIILPVGISFFTFQTMSHTIDVYRNKMPSTSSLTELSTYVAFFPQLVAGPIERGAHLLPQFQRPRTLDGERFREGLWLIFWGLYKKVVVADSLAKVVNLAFGPYDEMQFSEMSTNGLYLLFAVYAFAIQIYCDFSGYSDIARGTAAMMGFDIMLNFNLPYFSKNPSEFWQRWHISLSSWLKDYLYIPMGGNRKGLSRTQVNLMITMLLGGLWHGAAWTFVIWGAFHGAILIIYRFIPDRIFSSRVKVWSLLQGGLMFHLVCFGWLLFRAQNLATVKFFVQNILTHFNTSPEAFESLRTILFYSWFLIVFQCIQYFSKKLNPLKNRHWFVRLNVWIFIIMSIISLATTGGHEFIYFAF